MATVSMRAEIAYLHKRDKHMPAVQIAKKVGCSEKYVWTCLYQMGLKIGDDFCPQEPLRQGSRVFPLSAVTKRNTMCRRYWLEGGKLVQCLCETKSGATYCEDCARHLVTCLDRVVPEPTSVTAPRQHAWREDINQHFERAKRTTARSAAA